ncbi:stalk domain-containing protein [Thermoanaerobacterium sp. RBIITD]|uniref:stalk domain-containing protein n=1 Tax=Thermoanaerobacterium sp. RBIITD TaxID=1550240 RepID=UPI000BBF4889|nr:stalk domain-containing protein [Thermoanaerobacterium sp. RBIITD]SNX54109.1 Copper amine oxidase N-terminal domain-containing protein [Thermoanaerobacterium sp. RBIITD]
MKKTLKVALSALLISTMLIPAAGFADKTSNSVTLTSTTMTTTSTASTTTNTPAASSHHIAGLPNEPVYESNPNIYIEGKKVDFRNTQEIQKVNGTYQVVTVNRPILIVRGRVMMPLRAFIYYITNYVNVVKSQVGGAVGPPDIVYWDPGYKSNRPDGFIINSVRYDNELNGSGYPMPADPWKLGFFIRMPYIVKAIDNPYHYMLFKTDVPPLIMDDGVTYLPLRAEANAFGYGVKFDQATNSIYISKNLPIEYGDQFKKITDVVPPNGMISGNVGVIAFDGNTGQLYTMTDTYGNYTTQYVEPWK